MTGLGERLRELRLARARGLKRVAPDLGVSYTYLSKLENGLVEPSPKTLLRLAEYYEVSFEGLAGLAGRLPDDLMARLQADPEGLISVLREHFRARPR